jgi:hypothetical protein
MCEEMCHFFQQCLCIKMFYGNFLSALRAELSFVLMAAIKAGNRFHYIDIGKLIWLLFLTQFFQVI